MDFELIREQKLMGNVNEGIKIILIAKELVRRKRNMTEYDYWKIFPKYRLRSEAAFTGRTLKEGYPEFERPGLSERKEKLGEAPGQRYPKKPA